MDRARGRRGAVCGMTRTRGVSDKGNEKADGIEGSASGTGIRSGKHINLFKDLEQQAMMTVRRKRLGTLAKCCPRTGTQTSVVKLQTTSKTRRKRNLRFKSMNDPLTNWLCDRPRDQHSLELAHVPETTIGLVILINLHPCTIVSLRRSASMPIVPLVLEQSIHVVPAFTLENRRRDVLSCIRLVVI
ncbi:hypothetical protein OG21DRAFT_613470 [Imleria badia]|nr:hypothetical protein OG21DRAFT_613470 [Imleria badia]